MPRVPVYEQQVNLSTPNVPEQRLAEPLRAAYGENVAQADQRIGAAGQDLGQVLMEHQRKRQNEKDQAMVAELDTNFRLNLQNKLLNDSPEKVTVNGQEIERPSGLLSRNLDQTSGSTQEFDKYYSDARKQYLTSAPNARMAGELGIKLDNQYVQAREMVIKHEAKQNELTLVNKQNANLNQQIHDAASIGEPLALSVAVENAMRTQDAISTILGSDEETSENKRKDKAGDIVSKSITSVLSSTGNLEQAQLMLDSMKDNLHPDRYETLDQTLISGAEKMQKQQERVETQRNISNEADYLTKLSSGQMSWMNTDDLAKDVRAGAISDKFALALMDVIKAEGEYEPASDENKNYPAFIESIYKAKDQEELHKSLLNILQDNKNMSQEKLSVLINGAMQRSKALPLSTKLGDDSQVDSKQQAIDSAAMAVTNFGRRAGMSNNEIADIYQNYYKDISNNKSPKESYENAIKAHVVSQYPPAATMEQPPNLIIDSNSPIRVIFPRKNPEKKETGSKKSNTEKDSKK